MRNVVFLHLASCELTEKQQLGTDALDEALDLLRSHAFLVRVHLPTLLSCSAHLLSDISGSVRTRALSLLRFVLATTHEESGGAETLEPLGDRVVLHALAALADLDDAVRADALAALELLVKYVPNAVVAGWQEQAQDSSTAPAATTATGQKVIDALLATLRVRQDGGEQAGTSASASKGKNKAAATSTYTRALTGDVSPSTRLGVLRALAAFLHAAQSSAGHATAEQEGGERETGRNITSGSFLASSFRTRAAHAGLMQRHLPRSQRAQTPMDTMDGALDSCALMGVGLGAPFASSATSAPRGGFFASANGQSGTSARARLRETLAPVLVAAVLDAAPTACAPDDGSTAAEARKQALETLCSALDVARALFSRADGGDDVDADEEGEEGDETGERSGEKRRKLLTQIVMHVAPYFPLGAAHTTTSAREMDERRLALDILFAELASLLIKPRSAAAAQETSEVATTAVALGTSAARSLKKGAKRAAKARDDGARVEQLVERVESWMRDALDGKLATVAMPMGASLSAASFDALAPTIFALINRAVRAQDEEDVFARVVAYYERARAGTEQKTLALRFVVLVIDAQCNPAYTGHFKLAMPLQPDSAAAARLVLSLPRLLWDLGARDLDATECTLGFLATCARQAGHPRSLVSGEMLKTLAPQLAPLFHVNAGSRSLAGPFASLRDAQLEHKALDLAAYLVRATDAQELVKSVEQACATEQRLKVHLARWQAVQAAMAS